MPPSAKIRDPRAAAMAEFQQEKAAQKFKEQQAISLAEAEKNRQLQLQTIGKTGEETRKTAQAKFDRASGFLREFAGGEGFGTGDQLAGTAGAQGGPGEAEQILIKAQEAAGERDINRLQDVLSDAGIFSSGTLAVGTGEILGSTRGQVAQTLASSAENRLTRRHQSLLAKQQQLTSLIQSILV